MSNRKSNLRMYIAALALFVAGVGYLVHTGLDSGTTYHIDVADALALPENSAKPVRVFGTVREENLTRGANSIGVRFMLQDQNNPAAVITVVYAGAVPEGFKPGVELYAEGPCKPGDKTLQARELTTKCPSKYKKENRS